MPFTLFEKCKWKKMTWDRDREIKVNENDWKSRSRSESEMKKLRDRDREVKFLENLKRTDFDLSERVHLEVISFLYVIC